MTKRKITLSLDDKAVEQIKIQAVMERRSVSELINQLIYEYIKTKEKNKSD